MLKRLKQSLAIANDYCFIPWDDEEIQPGERWHEQIQKAIDRCQFGLLLVSPAFLGSEYIKNHELPAFVASNLTDPEPEKRVIPVALKRVPFDRSIDLKGLEHLQIFHDSDGKTFQERSGRIRDEFAAELFQQILKIVSRYATLPPAPDLHSQSVKFCAPPEDAIKPKVRKTAQELIVVILQQSDAATRRLAARFGLDGGRIVECRLQVAEKTLETLNKPLVELFKIALDEQQALLDERDERGANVVAQLVLSVLPIRHESGDVEGVRAHRLETGKLVELHASHKTIAELIMARADGRPAAYVRPHDLKEFTGGKACLARVPEGGRDSSGWQFQRDFTEDLVDTFESVIDAQFEYKFSDYLRRKFTDIDDDEDLDVWINEGLRLHAGYHARQFRAVGSDFTYYFLVETPPGFTDADRDAQNAVLLRLKARFPEIAFLRLAPLSRKELLPYSDLRALLYANRETD